MDLKERLEQLHEHKLEAAAHEGQEVTLTVEEVSDLYIFLGDNLYAGREGD